MPIRPLFKKTTPPVFEKIDLGGFTLATTTTGAITTTVSSAPTPAPAYIAKPVVGDTYRFKNGCAQALWTPVLGSQGGEVVEVHPGETVTVVKVADGWKLI